MRYTVVLVALALPVLTVADRSSSRPVPVTPTTSAPTAVVSPRYSPEQLQRLRQSLAAQIAVRDDAEGLRSATDQEAAALSAPAADLEAVSLPGGGVALRTDASQMSLAVAELADDGRVHVGERGLHGAGVPSRTMKGGAYVR